MDKAPHVPMFGHGVQRKRASSSSGTDLSDALTGVAEATKNAFSPQGQSEMPTLRHSTFSTSKAADLHSKYIQQLKDLMALNEMGDQRGTVVQLMHKLQTQGSE